VTHKPKPSTYGEDFRGMTLCKNCWDGNHYYRYEISRDVNDHGKPKKIIVSSGRGSNVFSNCLEGQCECQCRNLAKEKRPRVKRDTSAQITIMEVAGTIEVK
jgi:hypothetical protein